MASKYSERNGALTRAIAQMTETLELLDEYDAHQGAAYLDMAVICVRRELGISRRRDTVQGPAAAERLAPDFLHCNTEAPIEFVD